MILVRLRTLFFAAQKFGQTFSIRNPCFCVPQKTRTPQAADQNCLETIVSNPKLGNRKLAIEAACVFWEGGGVNPYLCVIPKGLYRGGRMLATCSIKHRSRTVGLTPPNGPVARRLTLWGGTLVGGWMLSVFCQNLGPNMIILEGLASTAWLFESSNRSSYSFGSWML